MKNKIIHNFENEYLEIYTSDNTDYGGLSHTCICEYKLFRREMMLL